MGVTSIDKNAFKGCEKLQSISIDTNNPYDYKRILNMLPDNLKEIVKNTSLIKCTNTYFMMQHSIFKTLPSDLNARIMTTVSAMSGLDINAGTAIEKFDANKDDTDKGLKF